MSDSAYYPFDNFKNFYRENMDLVWKYLKTDTLDMKVEDFSKEDVKDYLMKSQPMVLKYTGEKFHYSMAQKLEWIKCLVDVLYYIEKYIKIVSTTDGIIPFKMYDYQREFIQLCDQNKEVISTMSRQMGKCVVGDTIVTVYDESTGNVYDITIQKFHEMLELPE